MIDYLGRCRVLAQCVCLWPFFRVTREQLQLDSALLGGTRAPRASAESSAREKEALYYTLCGTVHERSPLSRRAVELGELKGECTLCADLTAPFAGKEPSHLSSPPCARADQLGESPSVDKTALLKLQWSLIRKLQVCTGPQAGDEEPLSQDGNLAGARLSHTLPEVCQHY